MHLPLFQITGILTTKSKFSTEQRYEQKQFETTSHKAMSKNHPRHTEVCQRKRIRTTQTNKQQRSNKND